MTPLLGVISGARRRTAAFTANTAVFDGTNDYISVSSLTGLSDSKVFTFSCWANFSGGNGTLQYICQFTTAGTARFYIVKNASNQIDILGRNAAGTNILILRGNVAITDATGWVHIYVCIDLANTSNRKIYTNGTSNTLTVTTYTDDTIDFAIATTPKYTIGASSSGGNKVFATLAELWMDDTYLDNVAAFASAGKPIYLGANGQTPTGTAPAMYYSLNGSGDSWATDSSGNGNTMTVTGALGTGTPP